MEKQKSKKEFEESFLALLSGVQKTIKESANTLELIAEQYKDASEEFTPTGCITEVLWEQETYRFYKYELMELGMALVSHIQGLLDTIHDRHYYLREDRVMEGQQDTH